MTVNWNDDVKVQLTDSGKTIYDKHLIQTYGQYAGDVKHLPDDYGYTTFQVWELMQIFGPNIPSGMSGPFVRGELEFE